MSTDLSNLLGANPLTAGSSMAGGNTVTDNSEAMSGRGTPSESSMDSPSRTAVSAQMGALQQPSTIVSGSESPSPGPWTRPGPQSGPWRQAADQPSQSQQPRDRGGKWTEQ